MNRLPDDRLRADLSELADLAVSTDLYDRVIASSRRATIRLTALALVVLAVVSTTVGVVIWSGGAMTPKPQPAGPHDPATVPAGEMPIGPGMFMFGGPGRRPGGDFNGGFGGPHHQHGHDGYRGGKPGDKGGDYDGGEPGTEATPATSATLAASEGLLT